MQILCLGDIAISTNLIRDWSPPANFSIDSNARILFNWELPIGTSINHIPRTRGPRLLSHPESIRVIRSWGPGIAVSNQSYSDAGEEGLADTIVPSAGWIQYSAQVLLERRSRGHSFETMRVSWRLLIGCFQKLILIGNAYWSNCWPGEIEAKRTIGEVKREVDWVLIFLLER